MNKQLFHGTMSVLVFLVVSSCAGNPESILRGTQQANAAQEQLVWVGRGESWVMEEGEWLRTPEQDYEFLVRQNRFDGFWESLKVQNRTHPEYNGLAGPADQQHLFRLVYGERDQSGRLPVTLTSSYGNGSGWSSADYRQAVLEFQAQGISSFAPYNTFRITQNYDYEAGLLVETVELFKRNEDGTESPYARIEERARIFRSY